MRIHVGFVNRRAERRKVRVLLIPTTTYAVCSYHCDLNKLASRLTGCQPCYEFLVLFDSGGGARDGRPQQALELKRGRALKHTCLRAAAPKSTTERERAVETYIADEDAYDQLIEYAREELQRRRERPLGDDIVIGIGSEVVVWDVPDNEFEGDVALDAYSSISVLADTAGHEGEYIDDNDQPVRLQQACFISLRRVNHVFEELIFSDKPERVRAIVARYLIMNIACFAGNRSFSKSTWHHTMSGCINESAWVGGERERYYVGGYCAKCATSYLGWGTAQRYGAWRPADLLAALQRMLRVPDELDEVVRSTERVLFWVQFGTIVVATNIVSNLLLDLVLKWDWDRDTTILFTHIKTHFLAASVALVSAVLASVLLGWHFRRHARLP